MTSPLGNFPLGTIVFLPSRFIYVPTTNPPLNDERFHCFTTDSTLIYLPFENDFGPLNIGQTYSFFAELSQKLRSPSYRRKCILYYSSPMYNFRANAVAMCALFMLLVLNKSAEEVSTLLKKQLNGCPLTPFRDCGLSPVSSHHMTVQDMLYGFGFAVNRKIFDISKFNYQDYMYYSAAENGDLTWIVPNKIIAFAGPIAETHAFYKHHPFSPKSYIGLFKEKRVTAVIRLNESCYNGEDFIRAGVRHYNMPYPDGSCPSDTMIRQFIRIAHNEISQGGAIAVHCRAGLGRTATLIGIYLIWRYSFPAHLAIAYMRTLRPGSVIGQQQKFLLDFEKRIHTVLRQYSDQADIIPSSHQQQNRYGESESISTLTRIRSDIGNQEISVENTELHNRNYNEQVSARVDAKFQYVSGKHHIDPNDCGLHHTPTNDKEKKEDFITENNTPKSKHNIKDNYGNNNTFCQSQSYSSVYLNSTNRNSDPLYKSTHDENLMRLDPIYKSTTDLHTPVGVSNAINETVYGKNALYSSSTLRSTNQATSGLKVCKSGTKLTSVSGVKGIYWQGVITDADTTQEFSNNGNRVHKVISTLNPIKKK